MDGAFWGKPEVDWRSAVSRARTGAHRPTGWRRRLAMVGPPVSFPQTSWTLVIEASDPSRREAALQELLGRYWLPLYVYLRRRGASE